MHDSNHPAFARPLVNQARSAIRAGQYDQAVMLLQSSHPAASRDGFAWNLLGVAHECRKEWKQARHCYGKAMLADPALNAPQQNLRRIYELFTFSRSNEAIALGDHELLLRRHLETSLMKRRPVSTPI
ncbi:MAG TPA: tetratricopeptide repeat protein [Tepidisphaeraceae bacterium]|jgi:Flp pilus assembly protein TadD|nr:tetratricopeptide repeat protein [Tepidisphaeraceae bacterium]